MIEGIPVDMELIPRVITDKLFDCLMMNRALCTGTFFDQPLSHNQCADVLKP